MTQSLLPNEIVRNRKPLRLAPSGYSEASWAGVSTTVDGILKDCFAAKRYPLFVHGPTGTGKTCLSALLFRSCSAPPIWARADDLLLSLACGRSSEARIQLELSTEAGDKETRRARKGLTYNDVMHRIAETRSLHLDDIGIREPTDTMRQIFFDLLEIRKGKPFVITSNHSPEQLGELFRDDRILSRILFGTVIHMNHGGDRRDGHGRRFLV